MMYMYALSGEISETPRST